ncbi:MAG: aminotransferase class V-fold PLP-dependent enzyme [Gammaproteobacteria bacterium]|nr:aminotransferase class V-fold PLP-dependent enzyme [Gammaproteobacteria bacterium]NIR84524.1 aminotransferase class V-fold PLP-dependent enzyme [Gammaproteobacteria bacterium]NIR90427.1 aminotransferase class V-fold PLP-dependent enzyme [Gammaproteobacteria bacterium]NIU05575.1 aminotransferase class V-fold PLP-dependent enzyme [Gammaproteobacteria bacterium]NIV52714.1 aminotransferase class V-fold PLP-dependent enzyme [Gammaproteobacteria bacterium]
MSDANGSGGIDVARARAETPACAHVKHFNNCGAALMPQAVIEAVKRHIDREALMGGYEAADAAAGEIQSVYASLARLIGCRTEEIALVENATVAWNMAFVSLRFRPGDRILTAMAEYASNYLNFLHVARRHGVSIEPVPNDESGQLDTRALAERLDARVKLIAVTHVPTNGGLVNPAAAIGRIAREAGVPFLLDACQSAGQMPLDVEAMGCDLLSATGRKFLRGPRGTGFLYVRQGFLEQLEPPWLDLRAAEWTGPESYEMRPDARRFENWEFNVAGLLGLGVAVNYALAWGLEAIERRARGLAERLRTGLREIPGARVHDLGREPCAIVSFTLSAGEPADITARLKQEGFNLSVSGAPSTLLDMRARGIAHLVRAAPHYYNTEDEVDALLAALRRLA